MFGVVNRQPLAHAVRQFIHVHFIGSRENNFADAEPLSRQQFFAFAANRQKSKGSGLASRILPPTLNIGCLFRQSTELTQNLLGRFHADIKHQFRYIPEMFGVVNAQTLANAGRQFIHIYFIGCGEDDFANAQTFCRQ